MSWCRDGSEVGRRILGAVQLTSAACLLPAGAAAPLPICSDLCWLEQSTGVGGPAVGLTTNSRRHSRLTYYRPAGGAVPATNLPASRGKYFT